MSKYQEALNELKEVIHDEFDGTKLLNSYLEKIKTLQELVDKHSKLEKIFGDRHICEIKARFNEIECDADKCDNCPLAIGDEMCLKITFEDKWQFQEERDDLKQKLLDQMKDSQ